MNIPRILIVDDSPLVLKILTKRLEDYGAEVVQAVNGKKALEFTLTQQFDMIITDVEMPYLNGLDLCQQLKKNPATRGVPVIMLSSHDSDSDIDRGFEVGAAAYISKSEIDNQLYTVIDSVLKKARFQRERCILIVDDSKTILKIVEECLAQAGFQVMTAKNGKEALELIQHRRPDLILSDIEMPVMDGVTFCERVRSRPDWATIPFVIMSSNKERAVMRRMLQRGASTYLVKPFNLEQLVITVEKLLSDQYLFLLKERERLDTERKLILASITSLIQALEARDSYTRGHSETVAGIVTGMAKKMKLDISDVEKINIGARLHDLGKIGVHDQILLKPGELTEKEFNIIKRHPIIGAEILRSIPSLAESIPIILHHHERFDGNGYPDRLKGARIPLWARMTAVADTYDALTSERPYRWAISIDSALEIIEKIRGTQLCPECVDIFLEWISTERDKG